MSSRQTILLTGASSGIGSQLAIQLSERFDLILNGRDESRLEATRTRCFDPARHLVWACDLVKVDQLAESLSSFLGSNTRQVNGFVHCAASLKLLPLRAMDLSIARETMDVNFFSATEILRALLKRKINAQALESVVFISTIASKFGAKAFSLYSASKGALDALMRCLAVELAPQVRVNSVLPGAIQTPMTSQIFANSETVEKLERAYPLGVGKPADIANAVEFLLSEKSRWITGQQMIVDGGRTANISA